jgi:hypothetical protein
MTPRPRHGPPPCGTTPDEEKRKQNKRKRNDGWPWPVEESGARRRAMAMDDEVVITAIASARSLAKQASDHPAAGGGLRRTSTALCSRVRVAPTSASSPLGTGTGS